jgi:hypothetical protein
MATQMLPLLDMLSRETCIWCSRKASGNGWAVGCVGWGGCCSEAGKEVMEIITVSEVWCEKKFAVVSFRVNYGWVSTYSWIIVFWLVSE